MYYSAAPWVQENWNFIYAVCCVCTGNLTVKFFKNFPLSKSGSESQFHPNSFCWIPSNPDRFSMCSFWMKDCTQNPKVIFITMSRGLQQMIYDLFRTTHKHNKNSSFKNILVFRWCFVKYVVIMFDNRQRTVCVSFLKNKKNKKLQVKSASKVHQSKN